MEDEFGYLFMVDNDGFEEIIFLVIFDGINICIWGGIIFIIYVVVGGNMNLIEFGIDGGWGGICIISVLVNKFLIIGLSVEVVVFFEGNSVNYFLLNVFGGY